MNRILLPILLLVFSCEEVLESIKEGCTTATACNYDATAMKDDGSCIAPEGCNNWCEGDSLSAQELDCADVCGGANICGCNDTTALNYDADATFNDGSCEFDTTTPSVVITFPVNNSTLDSIATIKADVTDNNDIISVTFLIDGTEAYADSTAPYEYEWDVCVLGTGTHSVLVKAEDSAGNQGQSDISTFTLNASYDCADVCGGDGLLDNCEVCDADTTNDCTADCNGNYGGEAYTDECDDCVGGNTALTACLQDECAVEIGQLLNVDLTIIGTAGKVGSTYTIQARIINVETGEALQIAKFTHKGEIDELLSIGIESIAHELLGLPYQKKIKPTSPILPS